MTTRRQDGNVIHADFGRKPPVTGPLFTVSCEMLFMDEHVALARLTYDFCGKVFIQHVCKGAGIDV